MHRLGYALSPIQHEIIHKGSRISAITAMASAGVVAVEVATRSVNREVFFDFVHIQLIPQMLLTTVT